MKRNLIFLIVFFIAFKGEIFPQSAMGWDSKFAFGGGFTPAWLIPDYGDINNRIEKLGIGKLNSSGFFATGGTGFVSIPMIKNFRFGGMGLGGSTTEKATVNGLNREVNYSASLYGVTLEYILPFVPDVAVSVGAIVGGGNVTVKLYQNTGAVSWDNIWNEFNPGQASQNIHDELSNSFFMIAPTLNVDIPVNRFLAFRVGAGYRIAAGGKWNIDNGQTINNVPDINKNALFIQTGIFIGYFNY